MLDSGQNILINLYNTNNETEHCKIFNELQNWLKVFDINQNKRIIFAGDFNIFFVSKLETRGCKTPREENSLEYYLTSKKAWTFVIFEELEILSVKILHLDKTITSDL